MFAWDWIVVFHRAVRQFNRGVSVFDDGARLCNGGGVVTNSGAVALNGGVGFYNGGGVEHNGVIKIFNGGGVGINGFLVIYNGGAVDCFYCEGANFPWNRIGLLYGAFGYYSADAGLRQWSTDERGPEFGIFGLDAGGSVN